jgi:hypothetical protein
MIPEIASDYLNRGWQPIPVRIRTKAPVLPGWQKLRLRQDQLADYLVDPCNVGIILGEPSGGLVDVDIDDLTALCLADRFLPPTQAIFGRESKPRSHRLYRVTDPGPTRKFQANKNLVVEYRANGSQTVFPGSIHPSGEVVEWVENGAPAEVSREVLLDALDRLLDAVRVALTGQELLERALNNVSVGTRNERGFQLACHLRDSGMPECEARLVLHEYARRVPQGNSPYTAEEGAASLYQAYSRPPRPAACVGADGDKPVSAQGETLPTIVIDTDEHRAVDQAVAALAADPGLYQRGGMLVRVLHEARPEDAIVRDNVSPTISRLPQPCLRERLTKFAVLNKYVLRGDAVVKVSVHPPQWLVAAVDARGAWPGIRPLLAVTDTPVIRADGSIWQTPGYDAETGVLYDASEQFPTVPDDPTADEIQAAVETLLEVVCDYRFESACHRAAWLAGLLTPLARFAFDGPAPLFLVDANVRGAGKGLLLHVIGAIVAGRPMSAFSYAHDADEMRKRITAIAIAGDRFVLLDNLEGKFGNDALDRALTTTRWKDRLLGENEIVDLPLVPTWYATGNNVAVAADTTRRIIHVRLDVLEEHPESRQDFHHRDLLTWVCQNRARLLRAALTILIGYSRAGCPPQTLTPFGSFEGWSSCVRSAVVWAGLPDPCMTRIGLEEYSDTTSDALGQLIRAWRTYDPIEKGVVVSELIATIYRRDCPPIDEASVAMRAAIENFVNCPPGKTPSARQFGNKLRTVRRRVNGGFWLDIDIRDRRRTGAVWRLVTAAAKPCDSASLVSLNPTP